MSEIRRELLQCRVGEGTVEKVDGAVARQRFCLPRDFIGFCGHFPGHPIVPAVVQILMAQLVVEHALDAGFRLTSIERAKFLRQLQPQDPIDVCCQCKTVRGRDVVDARLFVDAELVAAFWLVEESSDGDKLQVG